MISLGRAFEDGQAYVALSRARRVKCIRVTDFHALHVSEHTLLYWTTTDSSEE